MHATFFVLGENTAQHPEIVKQTAEAGHEIGNHTYDHQNLATLSAQSMTEEVTKADTEIKKVTGKTPAFVRPPYGSVTNVGATYYPATDHRMVGRFRRLEDKKS